MRRLLALALSLLVLALVWWQVDLAAILAAAGAADPLWLGAGLLAVIPLTLGTALRFGMLSCSPIGLRTATRLTLSASTLNLFLPSKLGDLAKAWVLTNRHGFDARLAFALVVMEKMIDLAALLLWGMLALLWVGAGDPLFLAAAAAVAGLLGLLLVLLSPNALAPRLIGLLGSRARGFGEEWRTGIAWFWSERRRVAWVAAMSLALWAAHLAQFWLFARALGFVPFVDNMAFATLAILAGLLPFTMAGIGTRDAAIVLLYAPWLSPGEGAVLGVLATLRYLLPALAGLPFVRDFWDRGGVNPARESSSAATS